MEEIRIRAVERVQAGESPEVVIKTLGFARACIYNWLARYRAGGWHSLRTGQRSGRPKKLTGTQIKWVYQTVRDEDPRQLKFDFALWTRSVIADLIKRQFCTRLSLTSIGRLLRQLGFSFAKSPCIAPTSEILNCSNNGKSRFSHRSKSVPRKKGRSSIFKMSLGSDRIFIPAPLGP